MTVVATVSAESIDQPHIPAGKTPKENEDYSLLPNTVVSSSDCTPTIHSATNTEVITNSRSVSSGDSQTVCRICQDPESNGSDLITLCNCTGSIAKYHVTCLEQWLGVSKSDACELCHERFQTKRKAKPFTAWLRGLRSTPQCRYIYGDILCLLILTPLAMTSAALCGEGSWYYVSIGQMFIAIGLVALCTFLILLYIVWLVLSIRYHVTMFHKWRAENQVVKVIIPTRKRNHRAVVLKETVV